MHKINYFKFVMILMFLSLSGVNAFANANIPTADIEGAKDSSVVGRFSGSVIISYDHRNFDEVRFPLSTLKPFEDKRDNHNNIYFEPEKSKTLEGKHTRIVYLTPEGTSPLEVVRNYQQEFGGELLYECKEAECGGDSGRSCGGGGGHMSLAMYLRPAEKIQDPNFSNGNCAQTKGISDQRYALLESSQGGTYVSILSYIIYDDLYCKALNNRTIAIVDIAETKEMESKMVTIDAETIAKEIISKGSVALYGIYFDSGKSQVKSESKDALEQIADFLGKNPDQNLLVVGHTDNVDTFEFNQELSTRRAEAVVSTLVGNYGIDVSRLKPFGVSYACPVAPNSTEEGRAKNRRVELVGN